MDRPPLPIRLANASEGTVMEAMVTAITVAAVVRKEVFMVFLKKMDEKERASVEYFAEP
jgi:hypothetical protein